MEHNLWLLELRDFFRSRYHNSTSREREHVKLLLTNNDKWVLMIPLPSLMKRALILGKMAFLLSFDDENKFSSPSEPCAPNSTVFWLSIYLPSGLRLFFWCLWVLYCYYKNQPTWYALQFSGGMYMKKERICLDGSLIILWFSIESIICSSLEFWATHHSPYQVDRPCMVWPRTFYLHKQNAHHEPASWVCRPASNIALSLRDSSTQSTACLWILELLAACLDRSKESKSTFTSAACFVLNCAPSPDWLLQPPCVRPFLFFIGFCKLSGGKYQEIAHARTVWGNVTCSIWQIQGYSGLPFHNERLFMRSLGIVDKEQMET